MDSPALTSNKIEMRVQLSGEMIAMIDDFLGLSAKDSPEEKRCEFIAETLEDWHEQAQKSPFVVKMLRNDLRAC